MKDTDGSAKEGTVHKAIRHDSAHKHVSGAAKYVDDIACLLYTSPSPRDATLSRMPSSA